MLFSRRSLTWGPFVGKFEPRKSIHHTIFGHLFDVASRIILTFKPGGLSESEIAKATLVAIFRCANSVSRCRPGSERGMSELSRRQYHKKCPMF
jgi:hypothetical protein